MVCGVFAYRTRMAWTLMWGLFAVVLLGKLATLQKAPPAIFILQLILAFMLLKSLRINLRLLIVIGAMMTALFLAVISATMQVDDMAGALEFFYYRTFDVPNQSLLEYFAAYPEVLPY